MSILRPSEGQPAPGPRTTGRRPGTIDAPLWAPGWLIQYSLGAVAVFNWFEDGDPLVGVILWVGFSIIMVMRMCVGYLRDFVVETDDE